VTAATCITALVVSAWATAVAAADPSPGPEDSAAPASLAPEATTSSGGDAQPWTETEVGDVRAIASGVAPFVAVGATGFPPQAAAWTSQDGLTWTAAAVTDPVVGSTMTKVVPVADGFVAMGVESVGDEGATNRARAWRSADGLTWEPAAVGRPAKGELQAVVTDLAEGPAGGLALGSFIGQDLATQRLWRSATGDGWTRADLPKAKGSIWDAVAGSPEGYLLLGQSRKGKASNWSSADGQSWQRLTKTPRLFDVAFAPDGTAVGIGWKDIWQSSDLKTWTKAWSRPKAWKVGSGNAFAWVAWDGSEFLVAGYDYSGCEPNTDECQRNPLLVSSDGLTWGEAAGPDGQPGADVATWLEGVASDGEAIVLEGRHEGADVTWLVEGAMAEAGSPA